MGILGAIAFSAAAALGQAGGSGAPVTGQSIEQRKDNQQERIGNGMENGSLTAGESSRLENQEKNLNREEHNMRSADDGKLTAADKARFTRQQNRISNNIYRDKHNGIHQSKVNNEVNARDRLQQERIGQGVKSGSLTAGEAAKLEHKEAGLNREQRNMRAGNGGKLTPGEESQGQPPAEQHVPADLPQETQRAEAELEHDTASGRILRKFRRVFFIVDTVISANGEGARRDFRIFVSTSQPGPAPPQILILGSVQHFQR